MLNILQSQKLGATGRTFNWGGTGLSGLSSSVASDIGAVKLVLSRAVDERWKATALK
jgi:hypothetical protein